MPWCQSLLTSNLYYVSGLSVFFFWVFSPDKFCCFFNDKKFEKIEENFALILLNVTQVFFISQFFVIRERKIKPWSNG